MSEVGCSYLRRCKQRLLISPGSTMWLSFAARSVWWWIKLRVERRSRPVPHQRPLFMIRRSKPGKTWCNWKQLGRLIISSTNLHSYCSLYSRVIKLVQSREGKSEYSDGCSERLILCLRTEGGNTEQDCSGFQCASGGRCGFMCKAWHKQLCTQWSEIIKNNSSKATCWHEMTEWML